MSKRRPLPFAFFESDSPIQTPRGGTLGTKYYYVGIPFTNKKMAIQVLNQTNRMIRDYNEMESVTKKALKTHRNVQLS